MANEKQERLCVICSKSIPKRRRKYCSNECRYQAKQIRRDAKREKKFCIICNNPRPKGSAFYCSIECVKKARNARQRKYNKKHIKTKAEREVRKLYMRVRRHGTVDLLLRKTLQEDKNPNWRGENAGYNAIHKWVREHKPKPLLCENCGLEKKLELSNKDHEYQRNLEDYRWLCDKCHYDYDIENGLRSNAEYNFYLGDVASKQIKIT
jgi:predicted nucleic acid-binding Zn ribbon protein